MAVDLACGLKRELVCKDGTTRIQYLHVNKAALYDFATADQFELKLLKHYESMLERLPTERPGSGLTVGNPLEAIGELSECENEFQLIEQVGAIVRTLGGSQFVYHSLQFDYAKNTSEATHATYLIDCRPGWMQQYISKAWSLDDPYLAYAARNLEPVLTSTLNSDRLNHWFVRGARDHAFVRGLIAPAHFTRKSLLGMLHVGCSGAAKGQSETLWKHRLILQVLSVNILSWQVNKARCDGRAKYDLDNIDVRVMRTYLIRKSVHDVADITGVTAGTVYATHFKRINRKMGTDRIALAAEKAFAEGLLD